MISISGVAKTKILKEITMSIISILTIISTIVIVMQDLAIPDFIILSYGIIVRHYFGVVVDNYPKS